MRTGQVLQDELIHVAPMCLLQTVSPQVEEVQCEWAHEMPCNAVTKLLQQDCAVSWCTLH
jgi:hypothetical protein